MSFGRTGFTTGTCAAAAAKAAVLALTGAYVTDVIEVALANGSRVSLPIAHVHRNENNAQAAVRKDAGDDPDVTDGCLVVVSVEWLGGSQIELRGGDGVGTVTKPGLSIPPGNPAINPVPQRMIRAAVREVTDRGVRVTISIPGGDELARKTFNPRLGVVGGLSILGTTGIVRPFSSTALREALLCVLRVASACGVTSPVFVPGRIGERAARAMFHLDPEQLIEVSNEWGFMLDEAASRGFEALLVVGHPGKLAKLPAGWWDTHSSRSGSAVPMVAALAQQIIGRSVGEPLTVEGLFTTLDKSARRAVADALAAQVRQTVTERIGGRFPVAVVLVDMVGAFLGTAGDISRWRQKSTR